MKPFVISQHEKDRASIRELRDSEALPFSRDYSFTFSAKGSIEVGDDE